MKISIENNNLTVSQLKCFDLEKTLDCGQAFRWNKNINGSYTGVAYSKPLTIKQSGNELYFYDISKTDFELIWADYFDLNRDYDTIEKSLATDDVMKAATKYGSGIRLLKQDLWETIISFIISANNNIPRIKLIIERISKEYGEKIIFRGKEYYTFPTPEQMKNAEVKDFRVLGLGFRDIRLYETIQRTLKKQIDLEKIRREKNIEDLRNSLLQIPGVGPKVADCIMLFSLKKYEVFPVDVWVRRVISELYFESKEQKPKEIQKFAEKQYGSLAGLAQQYLFYWRRDTA